MQTAKTTPRGKLFVTGSAGYAYNEMVDERGSSVSNVLPQIHARYGVTEQLDVGVKVFLWGGGAVDTKINLISADSALAVSLLGGFAAAHDVLDQHKNAWLLHVPLIALASYTLWDRVTPYAAFGYGFYWILGRSGISKEHPDASPAARKGHGDGLLQLSSGVEVTLTRRVTAIAEYDYWHPVVDDPGDYFSFADNHMFFLGLGVRLF